MYSRNTFLSQFLATAVAGGFVTFAGPAQGQLTEDLELLPGDGAAGHEFGYSTAIATGIAAIGARHDDDNGTDSGSAYLFDAATGAQYVKLLPSDGAAGDEFGFSIAIADGMVAVGARRDDDNGSRSGSAYVFDASTGAQLAKLVPSDGADGDEFGFAVAIVAVGAKRDDDNGRDSGSLYLFDAVSGAQLDKILPDDGAADDNLGESVGMDDGVVAAGAHGDDDNGPLSGSAYLFDVSSGSQLAKLLPLDGSSNDFFGTAIAIADGVVAVGAWADSIFFDHSGSAYLFDALSGTQISKLIPSDGHDRDHFGFAIDIDAGVVAVGAEQDGDSGFNAGSAYLFDATDGSETAKILASDGQAFDVFGSAIAIENGVVLVGAHGDDDNGASSGSAYIVSTGGSVGASLCFGDGSGAGCPCGNPGASGHGCANSSAAGALLFATGSASVASDDLVLRARRSSPSQTGLFFQGSGALAGGQGIVFGDGVRCVGGSIVRIELAFAGAQGAADSTISITTKGGVLAGQTRYYQWWYRDPAGPCGTAFNLSNAVEILWAP